MRVTMRWLDRISSAEVPARLDFSLPLTLILQIRRFTGNLPQGIMATQVLGICNNSMMF